MDFVSHTRSVWVTLGKCGTVTGRPLLSETLVGSVVVSRFLGSYDRGDVVVGALSPDPPRFMSIPLGTREGSRSHRTYGPDLRRPLIARRTRTQVTPS